MSATGRATTGYLRAHRMPAALLFVASLLCALLPVVALGGLNAYMGAVREGAAGRFGVVRVVLVRCTSASASWRKLCLSFSC